jgi:NADH:ubiquinone oxidoreductase subunit 6 (subunit J)
MTPSLLSIEGLTGLIFLIVCSVTLLGALIAVLERNLIRSVAGLALSFVGVAGIYYYLSSPFMAAMQILIYVGAVCVVIVFAVMLAEPEEMKRVSQSSITLWFSALFSGVLFFVSLAALGLKTEWNLQPTLINRGSVEDIGVSLMTKYSMSFELVSVVLLVSILGALVLARKGRDSQ